MSYVPDHFSKVNIIIKLVLWHLSAHKIMFTLYHSLLSVQEHYAMKQVYLTLHTLTKKYFIAKKNANHHLNLSESQHFC